MNITRDQTLITVSVKGHIKPRGRVLNILAL
jgi:hypothetical protein